jgi:plastocyanin
MSNETLFFFCGIVLVLAALGLSFVGIRSKDFPPRQVLIGVTVLFAAVVVGTAVYSVFNAEDEQEEREHELASEEVEAEAEVDKAEEGGPAPPQPASATEVALTSPEDGSLSFSPEGLEAPAGNITIEYDNPSQVGHNVAVELEGELLGESDTISGDVAILELTEVAPGEYVYYCTVPGHREGGMEGDLTVSGSEKS